MSVRAAAIRYTLSRWDALTLVLAMDGPGSTQRRGTLDAANDCWA